MASLFNKRLSPFDVPGDEKKESLFDEISERDSGRNVYLTSQAAPYLICSVLSVASVLSCSTDYLMSGLYYLVLIVLWSITFRFFERQKLIPLSLILNAGPVVALSFIPEAYAPGCPVWCYMPLALGFTFLGSREKGRAGIFREIVVPTAASVASAGFSFLTVGLFETSRLSTVILFSGLFLAAFSLLASVIAGRNICFTSEDLVSFDDMPSARKEVLDTFIRERLIFAGTALFCLLLMFVPDSLKPYMPFAILVFTAIVTLIARREGIARSLPYEGMILSFLIPLYPDLKGYILIVMFDLAVTALLFVYKRKTVFSERSIHVYGAPLMLILAGVFFALLEIAVSF